MALEASTFSQFFLVPNSKRSKNSKAFKRVCKVKKSFKNLNFLTLGIFLAKYKEWNLIRIFFPDTLEAWQLISIFLLGGSPPPPLFWQINPKILVEAGGS